MNVGTSVFLLQNYSDLSINEIYFCTLFYFKKLLKSMLLSKITNCLFFFVFCSLVKCLTDSVLSRADAGVVKCRLCCLRAPSNCTTIPAHRSWLGLNFVIKRNHLS